MKTKIAKKYIYDGLGFPIELEQVEMVKIEGEWQAKIDVRKVADMAMEALVTQPESLTGDQVHFIRTYFSMNLRDFAKVAGVTHTAANKWEKCGNDVTQMNPNIEKMLRLYIYEQVCLKTVAQRKAFYQTYLQVRDAPLAKKCVKSLHVEYAV